MREKEYTVLPPDREEKVLGIFVRDASFYRTFFPCSSSLSSNSWRRWR